MTATVGDTKMGRAVLEEGVATIDDISDELKGLRIRYGELDDENILGARGKRLGFGTVDQTISLGRGDKSV